MEFLHGLMFVIEYPLFKMGEDTLTLEVLLKLAGICALVLLAEYVLRRFFIMQLLRRTAFDAGLQYGIARIAGYVFIALGFYIALTNVGINLSSLAVVAGAVGIGIGFGLQNIIQNFVSGIIILAERPIALGDRIEVAGVAGTVKKISLRSTEIQTNDNISIIVPNSEFVTKSVTNWSHGDPRVRIRVPVGVAYGSDLAKVKEVLESAARENPDALKEPPPSVFFEGFGDSSLQFELAVWTSSLTHWPRRFKSQLNFAIERKMRENNIELPFPQRDLHIRSGELPIRRAETRGDDQDRARPVRNGP